MPELSEKGLSMPPSPIRKLVPYAEAAKRRGVKVYHLNIGQPDIETPQAALDAVHNIGDRIFTYGHSAGNEAYRRKMTEYYRKAGIDISYENIITTVGGSEAIMFALTACLDQGDEVLMPEPFYANYAAFATEVGAKVVAVTSTIADDFALPPIAEFEKHITPRTKAILICNPNNPTGYLYSEEEFDQLREIVLRHDLFLIVDEVYREFCYEGAKHFSALNLPGLDRNVIVVDSVSKRYSMCGVRLGALISRNEDVLDAALRMGQARLCPPFLAQVAAMAALDSPESYYTDVNAEYTKRRNCIVEALNSIEGVYCPMPKGAFYTVVKLPVDSSERFARWLLEEFDHEGSTVMVAPASGFYATEGLGADEVRIAYVLNCDDLLAAAECLRHALKAYPGRKL